MHYVHVVFGAKQLGLSRDLMLYPNLNCSVWKPQFNNTLLQWAP